MLSSSAKSLANGEPQKVSRDFFDSITKQYGSVPNIALMSGADALKIIITVFVIDQTGRRKGWLHPSTEKTIISIPNIHITFGETEEIELECISMKVLAEVENGTKPAYVHVYSDPITNTSHGTTTERGRRSW